LSNAAAEPFRGAAEENRFDRVDFNAHRQSLLSTRIILRYRHSQVNLNSDTDLIMNLENSITFVRFLPQWFALFEKNARLFLTSEVATHTAQGVRSRSTEVFQSATDSVAFSREQGR
jgi:hypothetical protein